MKEQFFLEGDIATGTADPPGVAKEPEEETQKQGWLPKEAPLTDGQLLNSMRYNAILGVSCLVIFGFLSAVFKMYRIRLSLRRVTEKPPPLVKWHYSMLWCLQFVGILLTRSISYRLWIWRTLTVSDEELLLSAGLDALMLVKTFGIGVQLFLPLAIIVIPIHESAQRSVDGEDDDPGAFVKLTASNIEPGSRELWVHFACVYVFILYALLLLQWQLKRYVRLRHRYLSAGGELNVWRTRYFPETPEPERKLHHATVFYNLISNAAKMFIDKTKDGSVKRGLLTRLATLRKDETDKVLIDVQKGQSEHCRTVPEEDESSQGLADRSPVANSADDHLGSGEIVAIDEENSQSSNVNQTMTAVAS